jgi:hypothetical protein
MAKGASGIAMMPTMYPMSVDASQWWLMPSMLVNKTYFSRGIG